MLSYAYRTESAPFSNILQIFPLLSYSYFTLSRITYVPLCVFPKYTADGMFVA